MSRSISHYNSTTYASTCLDHQKATRCDRKARSYNQSTYIVRRHLHDTLVAKFDFWLHEVLRLCFRGGSKKNASRLREVLRRLWDLQ
jgi:hypothetical protein